MKGELTKIGMIHPGGEWGRERVDMRVRNLHNRLEGKPWGEE